MRPVATRLLLVVALSNCGAETDLTGTWRQDCEDDVGLCSFDPDNRFVLHIGHFGAEAAGLLVSYPVDADGPDPYENEDNGCFVLAGAKVSGSKRIEFGLRDFTHPGCVDGQVNFDLSREDEVLLGVFVCSKEEGPSERHRAVFTKTRGRPSNQCPK